MREETAMHSEHDDEPRPSDRAKTRTIALEIIAGVLVVGLLAWMGAMLVPFVLAVVLTIALSGACDWLERKGVPATVANLLATVAVAAALSITAGLVLMQAGSILGQSEEYIGQFSKLLDRVSRWSGGDRVLESLGMFGTEAGDGLADAGDSAPASGEASPESGGQASSTEATDPESPGPAYWDQLLRRNGQRLARWVASGIGGALGLLGGVVFFLALLFYMLQTRSAWVERIIRASLYLGLKPRRETLESIRDETVRFLRALSLVSLGYTVIVTVVLWSVGVPQPLLWGVLTGLLEFIPYFGPLIAMSMPLVVSLSLGNWWAPLVVIGQFAALHTLESYVVTPLIYGKAVKMDPVLLMLGLLVFGWIWGPLGLVAAMPVMILLRGLVEITPNTPALDALVDPEPDPKPDPESEPTAAGARAD